MRKMKIKSVFAVTLALLMSLACLIGCGEKTSQTGGDIAAGGVLRLSVNPEIEVTYDDNGNVIEVKSLNDDGSEILKGYSDYEGKAVRQVVTELVTAIGKAGYFVKDADGNVRQISIEIEPGPELPYEEFLDELVSDIRDCVNSNGWRSPLAVKGESDYGITDYVDTDYGPGNDGDTDYNNARKSQKKDAADKKKETAKGSDKNSASAPNSAINNTDIAGTTDYNDTDYGTNNDGVTDYNDTDYGPDNDGVTDYNDTDYGPNNYGVTD